MPTTLDHDESEDALATKASEAAAAATTEPDSSMEVGRGRVARATIWTAASAATPRLLSFVTMAVVARILTPRDFGVFAVAITVHTVIFSVATLGIGIVLTRGDVDVDEVAPTIAALALVSGLFVSLLMVAFATPLATTLGTPAAAAPLRVLAISLFLAGCFPIPGDLLIRDLRTKELFIAQISGMVPANLLLLALALGGAGAMAFAWSRVLEHLISGVLMYVFVRRFDWPRLNLKVAKRVLGFGLPVASAGGLSAILANTDYAVVGHVLGAYHLGFYLIAFNVASWPSALMGATLMTIIVPAFSRLAHTPGGPQRAIVSGAQIVGLISFPICALTLVLSRPLIVNIYGAKWAPAAPVLSTLAIYGAASVLCTFFSYTVVSQGRTRALLPLQLTWLAALIPAMIVGVHLRGIVGAGDAHVVAILGIVLPLYLVVFARTRIVRVRDPLLALLPPLLAAIAAGLAATLVRLAIRPELLELLVGLIVGLGVYLVAASPLMAKYIGADDLARLPAGQRLLSGYLAFGGHCRRQLSRVRAAALRRRRPDPDMP
jgi:PST family polysaccharide transporter